MFFLDGKRGDIIMLKGKQRAYLRSMANTLSPITQVGKEGLSDAFLTQLSNMLESRELVKVRILENSGLESKETANVAAEKLRAEFVQAIGSTFTLYRKSIDKPTIVLPK